MTKRDSLVLLAAAASSLLPTTSFASEPSPEACGSCASWTLFNPTPMDRLRPLTTDRPDMTEAAITVDAGHLQLESDLAVATFREAASGNPVSLDVLVSNLKIGLTNSVDLQLLIPSLGVALDNDGAAESSAGDAGARLKWNLFGNDGEGTAMALMPWFSVGADLRPAGGLNVPVAFSLPGDFGLGTMAVVNYVPSDDGRHAAEVAASASLGHDLVGDLAGYLEVFASALPVQREGELIASGGLTYGLGDNVQLDAGARGVVLGADRRLESFVGFSVRH